MFEIKGGKMFITKGDDASITVRLEEHTGVDHPFEKGDTLRLTVRNAVGGTVLAEWTATATESSGELVLNIDHAKTSTLNVGEYSADIQYTEAKTGEITTIFPVFKEHRDQLRMNGINTNWRNFWVMPEITN